MNNTMVKSNDGSIVYSENNPLAECAICRNEHSDIRDETCGIAICLYCANDRRQPYRPSRYLGQS